MVQMDELCRSGDKFFEGRLSRNMPDGAPVIVLIDDMNDNALNSIRADDNGQAVEPRVGYYVTVDEDNSVGTDQVAEISATMAVPENRAKVNDEGEVISGYSIFQPRIVYRNSGQSLWAYLHQFAQNALWPFQEGLFKTRGRIRSFGKFAFPVKEYYEVAVKDYPGALLGRYAELQRNAGQRGGLNSVNILQSEDEIQSGIGRVALIGNTRLFETYPSSFLAQMGRLAKWLSNFYLWQLWGRWTGVLPLSVVDRTFNNSVLRGVFAEMIWLGVLIAGYYAVSLPGIMEVRYPVLGELIFISVMFLLVHMNFTTPVLDSVVEPAGSRILRLAGRTPIGSVARGIARIPVLGRVSKGIAENFNWPFVAGLLPVAGIASIAWLFV